MFYHILLQCFYVSTIHFFISGIGGNKYIFCIYIPLKCILKLALLACIYCTYHSVKIEKSACHCTQFGLSALKIYSYKQHYKTFSIFSSARVASVGRNSSNISKPFFTKFCFNSRVISSPGPERTTFLILS